MPTDSERSPWEMPASRATQLDLDSGGERSEADDLLEARRAQAIGRIRAHKIHRFRVFLVLYLIVNALMIATWVLCAAMGWSQYFNGSILIVTIGIWGCLVAIVGYRAYQGTDYTEEQIQHEMQKMA
jgi:fatty acid desaturase